MDRSRLAELEKLRFKNPARANKLLEAELERVPEILLVEFLGAYGTTFRQLDRLADARWSYSVAELWAQEVEDRMGLALVRQKMAKVEVADGDYSAALDLLRNSLGIFAELGDQNSQGKVFVDLGLLYHDLERFPEALCCSKKAVKRLQETEFENLTGAFQVAAVSCHKLGLHQQVLESLSAGRRAVANCGKSWRIRFHWMEARLKKDLQPSEASIFLEAADYFIEIQETLDAAIATLQFAVWCKQRGEYTGLQEVAKRLQKLAFSAEGKLSASVLLQVYRAILGGKLSLNLLESAISSIKKSEASSSSSVGLDHRSNS